MEPKSVLPSIAVSLKDIEMRLTKVISECSLIT